MFWKELWEQKSFLKVEKFNPDEVLLLHIGAAVNVGKILGIKPNSHQSKVNYDLFVLCQVPELQSAEKLLPAGD